MGCRWMICIMTEKRNVLGWAVPFFALVPCCPCQGAHRLCIILYIAVGRRDTPWCTPPVAECKVSG